jgi:hypothetical protein
VGDASGHATRHEASAETHIWAAFASPRTTRSLSVGPLGVGAGPFFDRVVTIGRSASVYVGPLEIP